ncbi:MAG: plasmid maintenance system antidote protein [Rikenellaceae bacterium]
MTPDINIIKGIHPGIIIARELKKRSLAKGKFALQIQEYPQTLGAVILGKRDINPALSLKLENALGFEEGYFMVLQAYYDIKQQKKKQSQTPDLSKIRPVVFWDTDLTNIDWIKYKDAVIKRVFSRGNESEKSEIARFYGLNTLEL